MNECCDSALAYWGTSVCSVNQNGNSCNCLDEPNPCKITSCFYYVQDLEQCLYYVKCSEFGNERIDCVPPMAPSDIFVCQMICGTQHCEERECV